MLELNHVTKRFNLTGAKEDTRVALDNISLQIKPGEFITIIGGNGSGKSTTLNVVSGSLTPDQGTITLNGVDITKLKEYKRAAYFGRVFQDPMMGTSGDMSVIENLEIAFLRGKNHSPIKWGFSKRNKEYFIKQLKRLDLGLETRLNQKVGVMSGGQRQALTLLMATLRDRPSLKRMKKDYVTFSQNENAKLEFEIALDEEKNNFLIAKNEILKSNASNKKELIREEKEKMLDKMAKRFDITKQILLLDEHTAALDPKTARKVLELTNKIVRENNMTTLMVTHNMKDALTYGDRLIMFHLGHIILDVEGEEKKKLTPEDLLKMFEEADLKAIEQN
ncbi:MAG: ATP-binding cassette domain-containing protein [Bacilli bacterium]|nr:ATP-binding cassette domain-containing protein [Bacilli bacterium]